jgi:ElaB/YqjD/DUF883 family membrane-anchored ribosome-binding protein
MPNHSPAPQPSVVMLVHDIYVELQQLIKKQLLLTRHEYLDVCKQYAIATKNYAVGYSFYALAGVMLSLMIVNGLHTMFSPSVIEQGYLPLWSCYAILGLSWFVVGKWFVSRGAKQLKVFLHLEQYQESQAQQLVSQSDNSIRSELAESKLQLMAKLDSLVTAVSGTVHTTQDTVAAVQQVTESVRQAVNIRHHVSQHPWYFIGGSALLGYFARKLFVSPRVLAKGPETQSMTSPPNQDNQLLSNHSVSNSPAQTIHPIPAKSIFWSELRAIGRNSVLRSIQDIIASLIHQILSPPISLPTNNNPPNQKVVTP